MSKKQGINANKQTKFVRHRDIKMKDKEIKYERKIQVLMCQNICIKCVEKLKWKFHYDKYKPLRQPAKCQDCKNKVITKAYRTLCDKCAISKQVCPGCCEDFVSHNNKSSNNVSNIVSEDSCKVVDDILDMNVVDGEENEANNEQDDDYDEDVREDSDDDNVESNDYNR